MVAPFAALADLEARYPSELTLLAADENTGLRDDGRIDLALDDATTEIIAILQARYSTADLANLDETSLKKILTDPKNALVKQYQRLFEMENVELTFHESALSAIARRAIERKTGARGLRSIMEAILLDTMFELPALEGVREVVISDEVVTGSARPLYIYSEAKEKKGPVSA